MRLTALCLGVFLAGCSTAPPSDARVARGWEAAVREAPQAAPAPPGVFDLGAPGSPLPLERVLEAARVGHAGLRAAYARAVAAAQRPTQERSPSDPMFSLESESFPNGTLDFGRADNNKIMLSQELKWWGKLSLRGSKAEQEAAISEREAAEMELEVLGDVARVYYEVAYTNAVLALAKDNLASLQSLEQVTEVQYQAGRVPQKDVLQAQVEVARFANSIIELERDRATSIAELNRLLGRGPDASMGDPFGGDVAEGETKSDPYLDAARKSRPAIAGADLAIAKSKTGLSIAEKEYYPDVTVGGGFMDNAGEMDDGWMANVSVNLPLWFGRRRAAEREASADIRAAEHAADDTVARVLFEVKDAHTRMEASRRLAHTYETNVLPQAEQNLKAIEEGYRAGRVGFLDVIDARRTLYDVRLSWQRSRADFAQAEAKLRRATGGTGR